MTPRHHRQRLVRITPEEFTPRELRELKRLYREAQEHPSTAAFLRAHAIDLDDTSEADNEREDQEDRAYLQGLQDHPEPYVHVPESALDSFEAFDAFNQALADDDADPLLSTGFAPQPQEDQNARTAHQTDHADLRLHAARTAPASA